MPCSMHEHADSVRTPTRRRTRIASLNGPLLRLSKTCTTTDRAATPCRAADFDKLTKVLAFWSSTRGSQNLACCKWQGLLTSLKRITRPPISNALVDILGGQPNHIASRGPNSGSLSARRRRVALLPRPLAGIGGLMAACKLHRHST